MRLTNHQQYILRELEIPLWVERSAEPKIFNEDPEPGRKRLLTETVSSKDCDWDFVVQTGNHPSLCWLISKSGRLPDDTVIQNFMTALNLPHSDWLVLKSNTELEGSLTTIPSILTNTAYASLMLIQLDENSMQPEVRAIDHRVVIICKVEDFEQIDGKRKLWACVQSLIK